jgi:glycosyltransferase involved in cell wall biosynthesis
MLGDRIDTVMRRADVVTAGNAYLAARAEAAGCPRVERLPTVVDSLRYVPREPGKEGRAVVLGWIGSPATAHYLHALAPVVERLQLRHEIRAVAVGARVDQVAGTPFQAVAWSEAQESALLAGFDIGIMPLPDAPWERGKCGYKLIQYMACAVPVVASPVGVNREIVQPGVNGELAEGADAWEAALSRLIADPELRQRMGSEGRRRVEDWYSLQAQAPRLVTLLQEAARRGRV